MSPNDEALQERINRALASEDIPQIYFNGFVNVGASADVMIVLEQGGQPVAVLNTSYIVAKTLADKLAGTVRNFERKTDTVILTTQEVQERLAGED